MKIVGVDPGSVGLGICILDNGKITVLEQVNLKSGKLDFYERARVAKNACDLYLQPADVYAIETQWMGVNFMTASKISQIRGIAIGSIIGMTEHYEVLDVNAPQVRAFFNIPRGSEKELVHTATLAYLKDSDDERIVAEAMAMKSYDALDALAIAIFAENNYDRLRQLKLDKT